MLPPLRLFLFFVFGLSLVSAADRKPDSIKPATAESPAPNLLQFIYVLRLVPRLHDDSAWTDADHAIIGRHFAHLQAATKAGQVILAGRTLEAGGKTFGLVIFEAPDEPAARAFMNRDPSVAEKIMTAELHPYSVALQRK